MSIKFALLFSVIAVAPPGATRAFGQGSSPAGAVYAATNAPTGNEIVVYPRTSDGALQLGSRHTTGGLGTPRQSQFADLPDPLGSQGSVVLTEDNRWLLVTNAGSDQLSLFRVMETGLELVDVVPSGGEFPVSVTVRDNLIYVLNVGGDGAIAGFTRHGTHLERIPGNTRALGLGGPHVPNTVTTPAQLEFTPNGRALVLSDKPGTTGEPGSPGLVAGTGEIRVYPLDQWGALGADPVVTASAGNFSYAFTFDERGTLFVDEVFGNFPVDIANTMGGAVSSYRINHDGTLNVLAKSVENHQFATCWIVRYHDFIYVSNSNFNNISGYRIDPSGALALLDPPGSPLATPGPDTYPTDLAVTRSGHPRYLYSTNALTGTVAGFRIEPDGSLSPVTVATGLPVGTGAQGLAAQ